MNVVIISVLYWVIDIVNSKLKLHTLMKGFMLNHSTLHEGLANELVHCAQRVIVTHEATSVSAPSFMRGPKKAYE